MLQFCQEPDVDHRNLVDFIQRDSALDRLEHHKHTLVVTVMEPLANLFGRKSTELCHVQAVLRNLRAAHRLENRLFKRGPDRHDLARRFHLRAERTPAVDKLVERPLWQLHRNVVQRGFEAGGGGSGDRVLNLVKRVTNRDLGCDLGNRVAGRLGGQRRRAGNARIDLDNRVVKARGMQRKLAIAAALDTESIDDVPRRRAKHLVFAIAQRDRGRNHDAVARVHTDGIEVLHAANRDHVSVFIAHALKLDLFPTGDALLDQNLVNRRHAKAVGRDLVQLLLCFRDAAAGTAERERRTHNDRIADLACERERRVKLGHYQRGDHWLTDLDHRVLKELAILRLGDGHRVRAEEPYPVRFEKTVFRELHGERQPRLPAERG